MKKQEIQKLVKIGSILVIGVLAFDLTFNFMPHPDSMPPGITIPPHIRQNLLWIALVIIAFAGYIYIKRGKDLPSHERLLSGKIAGTLANDRQDIDGLKAQLEDGRTVALRFAPHCAREILSILKSGDPFECEALPDKHDARDQFRVRSIKNTSTSSEKIIDQIPPPVPHGSAQDVTLDKPKFIMNEHGDPVAMIYEKWLIEFKPHQIRDMFGLLQNAQRITVHGIERDSASGFVNIGKYRILHAISIDVDNARYVIH